MRCSPGRLLILSLLLVNAAGTRAAGEPETLKGAYGKYFDLGVALPGEGLSPEEKSLIVAQFTNVTSENCLKAAHVHPSEDTYAFAESDALVALAEQYHLKVNGHTLVYWNSSPAWFFADHGAPASRDLVLKRMTDHIAAVVGRYRGRIASWDVVNEAISDKPDEYLRDTPWKASLGEDYVLQAYLAAAKADPAADLYYNDFRIETPLKRQKALRLVQELRAHGAKVDGIGIQGHWVAGKVPFQDIEDSIAAFHQAGLKVMITELDLDVVPRNTSGADTSHKDAATDDPYAAGCPPAVLQQQSADYAALFRLFRKHAAEVRRVTFWNLDDGRSWLNSWPRKRTDYPLLWDRNLQPKPAFYAVIAAATEPLDPGAKP